MKRFAGLFAVLIIFALCTAACADPFYKTLQFRRGTLADWTTNNPIPKVGEPCYETDTNALRIGDGVNSYLSLKKFVSTSAISSVTTQFDKTTDTTLAAVPGLSVNLMSGTYLFKVNLFVTQDTTGVAKISLSGNVGVSRIIAQLVHDETVSVTSDRIVAMDYVSIPSAGSAQDHITIEGTVTITTSGTFLVKFAQKATTGTSSVLVGSSIQVTQVQ